MKLEGLSFIDSFQVVGFRLFSITFLKICTNTWNLLPQFPNWRVLFSKFPLIKRIFLPVKLNGLLFLMSSMKDLKSTFSIFSNQPISLWAQVNEKYRIDRSDLQIYKCWNQLQVELESSFQFVALKSNLSIFAMNQFVIFFSLFLKLQLWSDSFLFSKIVFNAAMNWNQLWKYSAWIDLSWIEWMEICFPLVALEPDLHTSNQGSPLRYFI